MNVPAYQDDANIPNEEVLFRAIPADNMHITWDDNQKLWRPTSAAFNDSHDDTPLSMYLRSALVASGRVPADLLTKHPGCALARITVQAVREAQQGIVVFPDEGDNAHVYVFGDKRVRNRRMMAKAAEWEIYAPPPPPASAQAPAAPAP